MDKVLLIIGDAAEVTDTLYPYFRVQEDGYQMVVAAPEKRVYHLVLHSNHPEWDITVESHAYPLASDIAFVDVEPEQYAGLVISGGRAPEYLATMRSNASKTAISKVPCPHAQRVGMPGPNEQATFVRTCLPPCGHRALPRTTIQLVGVNQPIVTAVRRAGRLSQVATL